MNTVMEKIQVKEVICHDITDHRLSDIVKILKSLNIGPEDVFFYSDWDTVQVVRMRLETDSEYEARIKPYTEKIRRQEEKELKEYQRLKAKYEGKQNEKNF